eukprot:scaffold342_cov106-Isochrysis_galbana.AAC.3
MTAGGLKLCAAGVLGDGARVGVLGRSRDVGVADAAVPPPGTPLSACGQRFPRHKSGGRCQACSACPRCAAVRSHALR